MIPGALSKLFALHVLDNVGKTFILEEALLSFGEKLDPRTRKDFEGLTSAIHDAIKDKEGSRFTICIALLLVAYRAQLDKKDLVTSTQRMQDLLYLFSNLISSVIPPSHPNHPQSRKDVS